MKCPQCGKATLPNPLLAMLSTANTAALLFFLSHVTPEPGWITNWHWLMWWAGAIVLPIQAVLALLFAGAWLSDPDGYKHRLAREQHQ